MTVRKKGWWLSLVLFSLLVSLGCFLYIQSSAQALAKQDEEPLKLEQPEPKVLTLTKQNVDPVELMRLFAQLKKDQFAIEARPLESLGFTACPTGETRTYKGSGLRMYYFRRPIPIRISSGPVYPDFLLQVLEFEQTSEAEDQAKWIESRGMLWDDHCVSMTSKEPEKIVVNGTTVYILFARAEMLRDFTEKYGNQLKGK